MLASDAKGYAERKADAKTETLDSVVSDLELHISEITKTRDDLQNNIDRLIGAVPREGATLGDKMPEDRTLIQRLRDLRRQAKEANEHLSSSSRRLGEQC